MAFKWPAGRLAAYAPLSRPTYDPYGPLAGYDAGQAPWGEPVWSRLRSCIYPVLDLCIDAYYVSINRHFQGDIEFVHHSTSIEQLVSEGADVEVRDAASGGSCLHFAAASGSVDICKILLAARARPSARDSQLQTPLWWAIAADHVEACKLLLKHEPELVLMTNIDQMTPLHEAARLGRNRLVALMLHALTVLRASQVQRAGPDLRAGKLLRTPLHLACSHRHLATVALLLKAQADPQVVCGLGRTALHHACAATKRIGSGARNGDAVLHELCYLILQRRPKTKRLRDAGGHTPAELAAMAGYLSPELRVLLAPKKMFMPTDEVQRK